MMLRYLLLLVSVVMLFGEVRTTEGVTFKTNEVPSDSTIGNTVHDYDFTACNSRGYDTANKFEANKHYFNEVKASAELWDDYPPSGQTASSGDGSTSADYSGFVTSNAGVFQLTIAVPVVYSAQKTDIAFQRAAATTANMPNYSVTDSWTVTTCQQWPHDGTVGNAPSNYWTTNAPHGGVMDPGNCEDDQYADCYAVFRYSATWNAFTTALGICEPGNNSAVCTETNKGLTRIEYETYATTMPKTSSTASGKAGSGPAADGAKKYIEFCGEVLVDMEELFEDVGPYTYDITREVKDRFVFCLVFQTRVEVSANIEIYDEPDFFQLLRVQEAATLQPDDTLCPAQFQVNILTLVQSPFALTQFEVNLNIGTGTEYTPIAVWPAASAQTGWSHTGTEGQPWYLKLAGGQQTPHRDTLGTCNGVAPSPAALAATSTDDCQQDWAIKYCVDECEADGTIDLSFKVICRTAWAALSTNQCPLPGYTHTHCEAACTAANGGTAAGSNGCDCSTSGWTANPANAAADVECANAYGNCGSGTGTGDLNVDAVRKVTGTITLDSASYCAMLIEAIDVKGQMASYDDPRLTDAFARTDFVTGATACFKGSFWATTESGGANAAAPPICGISVLRIKLDSLTHTADTSGSTAAVFQENVWTGPAWKSTDNAPYTYTQRVLNTASARLNMCAIDGDGSAAVGPEQTSTTACTYGTYASGANSLNLDIFDFKTNFATDGVALGSQAGTASTAGTGAATDRASKIGFCYTLDRTLLAPTEHESFTLKTSALVEVVFCDTSKKKLMAVAFPYKNNAYERAGLLQLQDGPANLNEIEATVGMFDPLPVDPDNDEIPDNTPADDEEPDVIEKKTEELAVNTGGGMQIWPIVAGVVGAITVCIIVLLIALRRHRNGQKQKTVAVIPNTKGYGKVAVVTVKNGSGALP